MATQNNCLQGNIFICEFRYLQTPDQLGKIFTYTPILIEIVLQSKFGSNKLSEDDSLNFARGSVTAKMFTVPLTEYDNWNPVRGFPTAFSFPLGTKQFSSRKTIVYVCGLPLVEGGLIIPYYSFSYLIFETFRVLSPKIYLSYQNCEIFHDSNVGLFWRYPGQCGAP